MQYFRNWSASVCDMFTESSQLTTPDSHCTVTKINSLKWVHQTGISFA